MKPILEINNISKKYFIDHERAAYLSLRDRITGIFRIKTKQEEFWALKNVSFDVKQGESLGIIGSNGAGKSTLLKILSRITPPTEGHITVRGRIASLLEVGTGFHQELTGRDNIFMNGSILGMKRAEINNKFDEIVEFSGVEKFLDTPLKNYSSGMQLRLAFAVAAYLEPEILIIDEVLAVGDAEFQKKCLGKMEDVNKSGRTILFVSHNMTMINQLCEKSIVLSKGTIAQAGVTSAIVSKYLLEDSKNNFSVNRYQLGKGVSIAHITIPEISKSFSDIQINLVLASEEQLMIDSIGFFISNIYEERMGIIDLRRQRYKIERNGHLKFSVTVLNNPLIEGSYKLGLFIGSNVLNGNFGDLARFQIYANDRTENMIPYPLEVRGKVEFNYAFTNQ